MDATLQCWYMVIEVWISGQMQTSREVPAGQLADLPGISWKANAEFRESRIRRELDQLEKDLRKIYHREVQITYQLVFQSKLNNGEIHDEP